MNCKTLLAIGAACAALAGCGGGGGGGTTGGLAAGSGVPNSALSDSASLVAYLRQLIAGTDETSEPVALGGVTLPVDDTAEPAAL